MRHFYFSHFICGHANNSLAAKLGTFVQLLYAYVTSNSLSLARPYPWLSTLATALVPIYSVIYSDWILFESVKNKRIFIQYLSLLSHLYVAGAFRFYCGCISRARARLVDIEVPVDGAAASELVQNTANLWAQSVNSFNYDYSVLATIYQSLSQCINWHTIGARALEEERKH